MITFMDDLYVLRIISNVWHKRAIFSSIQEFNCFKEYLHLINMEDAANTFLADDIDFKGMDRGWGLTQEEYEAALEFNKIWIK